MTKKTNKKSKEDQVDTDKWQLEFTEAIVMEAYHLIKQQEEIYGIEFADSLRLSIIASFVSTFIYEVLSSTGDEVKSSGLITAVDIKHSVFTDAKEALEIAVGSGVEGAVKAWSGKDIQYYCEIAPEPVPLNIEPC